MERHLQLSISLLELRISCRVILWRSPGSIQNENYEWSRNKNSPLIPQRNLSCIDLKYLSRESLHCRCFLATFCLMEWNVLASHSFISKPNWITLREIKGQLINCTPSENYNTLSAQRALQRPLQQLWTSHLLQTRGLSARQWLYQQETPSRPMLCWLLCIIMFFLIIQNFKQIIP